jgi:hypothetical protein
MDPVTTFVIVSLGGIGVYMWWSATQAGSINMLFSHFGGYKTSKMIAKNINNDPQSYDASFYNGPMN